MGNNGTGIDILKNVLLFQTMDFPQRFFETPTLVTTPKHHKDDVNAIIDPDNNAITEWIEVRNFKKFLFPSETTVVFLCQVLKIRVML